MKRETDGLHHRRSLRLKGHDYSQAGAYFITICTQGKQCLFGDIVEGQMRLNENGKIVHEEWLRTTAIRREVALDAFVVMPNHFHAVVVINAVGTHAVTNHRGSISIDRRGESPTRPYTSEHPHGYESGSISSVIGHFKSSVTKRINLLRETPTAPIWQRNYYEHVIRNGDDLAQVREYILNNPVRWELDEDFP